MENNERKIEEFLLKQQHEAEVVKESLRQADEQEKANKESPILALDDVIEQMGNGMIEYPDLPIRIRLGKYFEDRVAIPIPIDFLKEHTNEDNIVTLLNDVFGISLTMQFTKTTDRKVTLDTVKKSLIGQMKGAGIYIEILEEGTVEDDIAPTNFITYRMPTARGVLYQMVFYSVNKNDDAMVIGNYNCFYKDLPIWENIIKATISYFTLN